MAIDEDDDVREVRSALAVPAILATDDTTIKSASSFSNFGPATSITVSAPTGDVEQSLIRFSQSQITTAIGSNALYSAKIRLRAASVPNGWNGARIAAFRMTRAWTEGTGSATGATGPTWVCALDSNTANAVNDCTAANAWDTKVGPFPHLSSGTSSVPLYFSATAQDVYLDVTADVQAFLTGTANYGWLLRSGVTAGPAISFASSETANGPALILDVGPDLCPTDSQKTGPGQCGCGVPDTDTDGDTIANCVEPALVPVADSVVKGLYPNRNGGHDTQLQLTRASVLGFEFPLIQFSQSQIAAQVSGKTLFSAYLELTITGESGTWRGGEVRMHRLTKPWTEGHGTDTGLGATGATWACANDTNTGNSSNDCTADNAWTMGTGTPKPFDTMIFAKAQLYSGSTKTIRFDVTTDVKAFLAGTPNYGWVMRGKDDVLSADWVNAGSRESANPPRLILTAGPACGTRTLPLKPGDHLRDAQCNAPAGETACSMKITATVNSDTQIASRQLVGKVISPAEFLSVGRDRQRKMHLLADDTAVSTSFCDGDDDGDMIGNSLDTCPGTRPLRATDDRGCEITTLPKGPNPTLVGATLANMGILYDPRCAGAPIPETPRLDMGSYTWNLYTIFASQHYGLYFSHTNNQPDGCEWEYQVEIYATKAGAGVGSWLYVKTFTPSEAFWLRWGTATDKWSLLFPQRNGSTVTAPPGGDFLDVRTFSIRMRVVNGLGLASPWTGPATVVQL